METDVHVSADGIVFAFHDDALDRVTDRRGRLQDLSAKTIEEADAGHTFSLDGGQTFPFRGKGIRVPRLEEILTRWPLLRVNIDPKRNGAVGPLIALLSRLDSFDRVCIGSFSDQRLARVREMSGGRVCTSMGPRAVTVSRFASLARTLPRQGAHCLQVPVRQYGIRIVDPMLVRAAHAAGLHVHVWTIDAEAEMHRLLDIGVDGLMSDRPRLLKAVLKARGAWTGHEGT